MHAAAYSGCILKSATPPSAARGTDGIASPLLVVALTAIAYAAVGAAALIMAGPPGYASPLYPSAGIALAAAVVYGRAAWFGAFLGAFAVNAGLGLLRGQSGLALLHLPALIALGAALQAAVGAMLIRRFVGPAVVLNAPRDIALAGLLGGLAACTISPSVATVALWMAGTLPPSAVPTNWLTWWSGDTLGVLIAAPLVLTLVGRPAADWRPRRRTLGLPLLLALGLVSAAVMHTNRLDRARQAALFERDAERLAAEARVRLSGALHALQALHGAAQVRGRLDSAALREASAWWLGQGMQLQAMGYAERVPTNRLVEFEAEVRAQGRPAFRVFDRDGGVAREARGEVLAIRYIEPDQDNSAALGVNALSIPAAREAIERTQRSGQPAATGLFVLTQSASQEAGIVLYQALHAGRPLTEAARLAQFTGVVFVTLRTESAMAGLTTPEQAFLHWCLVDTDAGTGRHRLAGPAGCEQRQAAPRELAHRHLMTWGGRQLSLDVLADPAAVTGAGRETAWLLALSGMGAAAMLGALLLVVTGQHRRTELAVRAGTDKLRGEAAERLQVEAALRESSERLRSILDNVPLGVMFLDPQGHLIECNPRLCEMADSTPGQLLGRSVAELVHPDDAANIRRMRRDLLKGQVRNTTEAVRLMRGNTEITVRVSASALRDAGGQTVRMVGVVEDITEVLRLEASERALHRAEAANRAKSDFLSRMSHELRTPLNAMIGFAQLLGLDREPGLVPHQREWTQQIQRAGWHLLEMINETLDLARIESGAVQLKLVPLDLAPMVAACRALVAGQAAQRPVALHEQLSPLVPGVMGDTTRLKQVLTNLLSNAIKYNRAGGSVQISSRPGAPGQIEIAITDTGLGMNEAQLQALFQPYNRLGREGSNIEGTGIGLVISKRLTELMGGTLAVSSREGVGSTFTLTLPAAVGAERSAPSYTESSPAPYQHRWVHYVEDNETNIEVMRGVLAQRSQVMLRTSMLGLDGLAAIRRDRPDLILLDMHLPDISGLELLRHLKQDDSVADIPVIVVSADATPGHMEQALTLGAQHYVTKPLDVAAFLALVDSALEAADTRWGM